MFNYVKLFIYLFRYLFEKKKKIPNSRVSSESKIAICLRKIGGNFRNREMITALMSSLARVRICVSRSRRRGWSTDGEARSAGGGECSSKLGIREMESGREA